MVMDSTGSGDTRARIQQVALVLFTEQGYEKTSLREIAEQLGVTKAALYYHFKSKEELIDSFVQDAVAPVDDLIDWFQSQPATMDTRREFVQRYAAVLGDGRHQRLMQLFLNNQAALQNMSAGLKMRDRFLRMLRVMVDPGAPLVEQLRIALAVWALHGSWFILRDTDAAPEEIRTAALQVSLEIVSQVAAESARQTG